MKDLKQKRKVISKERVLYWSPRIIGIVYILFLAVFALDVFIPGKTLSYYSVALFMHLIPNFILGILLFVSWKYERIGILFFSLAFIALFTIFWNESFIWMQLPLFSPLLLISLLFFIHLKYVQKMKYQGTHEH